MNRNQNSRFAYAPTVNIGRSKMNVDHDLLTTFNVGDVVPIYFEEILPGDSVSLQTNMLVRMQTLVAPIFSNLYLDTYYFFVPNRLCWSHFKEFCGENTQSAWIPQTEYEIPQITAPKDGWTTGTIADYFGIPTGKNLSVSALPFRAYATIMNEWFRSEAITDPLNIYVGDATVEGSNGDDYINDVALGGKPFKAAKFFDVFSGCLPSPQRGPEVTIDINPGSTVSVTGNGKALALNDGTDNLYGMVNGNAYTDVFGNPVGSTTTKPAHPGTTAALGVPTLSQLDDPANSGLVANLAGTGVITINQLREAFQIQKFYEKQALYGGRYTSVVKSMFGVTSPDARLQRPEYLGGSRATLNINQVIQTSSSSNTPQGNTAAYSLTANSHGDFSYSATEHGMIIGLAVVRYDHSYQQGLRRYWTKKSKFDFYWPVFANLGNVGVKNSEIFAQGTDVLNPDTGKAYDDEIFGYQEYGYDYRYHPSLVTGEMNSNFEQALDMWHLADHYESLPHLSDEWLREDKNNLDRALAVTSSVSNQLFGNFYFKSVMTRPMPLYSIPGLIDHH